MEGCVGQDLGAIDESPEVLRGELTCLGPHRAMMTPGPESSPMHLSLAAVGLKGFQNLLSAFQASRQK
jgi:hypothetical protein